MPECGVSTYSQLFVHIIFSTKGRKPSIEEHWRGELHAYLGGTARSLGATPLAVGGVADHVHLLLGLGTTASVASVVRELKKSSSQWSKDHDRHLVWQTGYAAFSVGRDAIQGVSSYIADQDRHHKGVSSKEELHRLLIDLGIEFDERYFE